MPAIVAACPRGPFSACYQLPSESLALPGHEATIPALHVFIDER